MTCQEALQQMTDYLQEKLTMKEEIELITHVESCESCFEELELNYIMQIGLDKLDEEQSSSMDFAAELQDYMEKSRKRYKKEKRLKRCIAGGIVFTIILILGLLCYIIYFM